MNIYVGNPVKCNTCTEIRILQLKINVIDKSFVMRTVKYKILRPLLESTKHCKYSYNILSK